MVSSIHRHLAILTAMLSIHNSISFPTSSQAFLTTTTTHAPSIPIHQSRKPTYLTAVESPMRPIEDEQEKDKSIGSRRFVPNFFRRKSSSSQPGTSEEESQIIQTVETLTAYKDEVVNQNDLVVVRFYAPWCKSCKASFPQFKQLISKYPQVKYVQVPLTKETAYIHEGLGVPSVPYAHIYHPTGGLVEEKKINKRVFGEFAETLDWYVRGECDLPVEEEIEVDEEGFQ